MNTDGLDGSPGHDEFLMLLPWYVNGTLREADRMRIEEHVRGCIVCRRELMAERRTLELFRQESHLDRSAQAAFERMHARIAGTGRRPRRRLADLGARLAEWFGTPARIALPALAVMAAVVMINIAPDRALVNGESGMGGTGLGTGGYRTLSDANVTPPRLGDVDVIFAEGTDIDTINRLLASIDAEIVAGPSGAGVYRVRLGNDAGDADRTAAIARLRGQGNVVFAEAAQPMALP